MSDNSYTEGVSCLSKEYNKSGTNQGHSKIVCLVRAPDEYHTMVQTLLSHRIPEISFVTFECQKVALKRLLQELLNTILIACEPL